MTEESKHVRERVASGRDRAKLLSCGRTLAEAIETIRKDGNYGPTSVLRAGVLAALGIASPKPEAEHGIIFGCYRPFKSPFLVRDYLRLLDLLGVEYTYFDRKYCCGFPLLRETTGEEQEQARALSLESNRLNLDLARQKGATTLAYCCIGCVHAAKHACQDAPDIHIYMVDLILDRLENHRLQIKPAVMGYFEGCHTSFRTAFPGIVLDWPRYRQRLDRIAGLKIVDLPQHLCCKKNAAEVVEKAEALNLDKIVCACNWCAATLQEAAQGKVRLVSLPALLLEGLQHP